MNYIDQYIREDKEYIFHEEDDVLDTIEVPLPQLDTWYSQQLKRDVTWEEAITFIDGYGLDPKDQYFRHQEIPERLKHIYEAVFNKLHVTNRTEYKKISDVDEQDIYNELENNREYYKEEIKWIKTQIKRRYVGYWFFNNGQPTYINGPNYFFLNFWWVDNEGRNNNRPDYRDYQRGMFLFFKHMNTTTLGFYKHRLFWREGEKLKEKFFNDWNALKDKRLELGNLGFDWGVQKDIGFWHDEEKRTVNGVNPVSARRTAKTAISVCYCYVGVTDMPDRNFIIQGMNLDHAKEKVFQEHLQVSFINMPFFFRPHIKGREDSGSGYKFDYDGSMAAAFKAGAVAPPLNANIKPMASTEKQADGMPVHFAYRDEPAKKLDEKAADQNIPKWWNNTVKPATQRGSQIIGFALIPSTVGEMEHGGGSGFFDLVNDSHYLDRNDNGTTATGLVNLLISGYIAMPDKIDRYGKTVVDDPPEPVLGIDGKWITEGSKTFLNNQIKHYEKEKKWERLTELLQNFPPDFKSAFSMSIKDIGQFPVELMKSRVADLKFDPKFKHVTTSIDFEWNDDSKTVRTNIHGHGRWLHSYLPPNAERNRVTQVSEDDGFYKPKSGGRIYGPDFSVADRFVIGFDPVAVNMRNKRIKGKGSLPAAAVYYKRDRVLDPDEKPREQWSSQDFVAFIRWRSDDMSEVYEEILKAAIFYGAYIYVEANTAANFIEWIQEKGYDGYLLRDTDPKTGEISKDIGVWATKENKEDMFKTVSIYFAQNVRYMKIWQIIDDWLQMRGADDLTDHDLAAASGWCLRAAKQVTGEVMKDHYKPATIRLSVPEFLV